MRNFNKLICGVIFLLLVSLPAVGQDNAAVDSLFFQGVKFYKESDFKEALEIFKLIDRVYNDHSRLTASILMQGKAHYHLGEFQEALAEFNKVINDFSESEYYDDAIYGKISVYYKRRMMKEAVILCMKLMDSSKDEQFLEKSAKLSSSIMKYRMNIAELKELFDIIKGERGKAAVTLNLAKREIKVYHYQTSIKYLKQFIEMYPESKYTGRMKELIINAESLGKGLMKIGVILPLSGSYSDEANSLLNGIKFALDKHNRVFNTRVELSIHDSENNIVKAVKIARELSDNEETLAIIGELSSNITAAIAGVTQSKGVPLVAPTAMMDGISTIGEGSFQISGELSTQGSILADYAVNGLGLKKFVILACGDEYGQTLRNSFAGEVIRHGGEIIAEEWYYEGVEQLKTQFQVIRKAGIEKMFNDSLIIQVPEEEWEEKYADQPIQNGILYVKKSIHELADSIDIKVTSIDGIFLPVKPEALVYVAPQLAFFNIDCHIFGGSYWYDLEFLKKHRDYIEGVYFVSDYYIDSSNYRYIQFVNNFRKKMGVSPGKMEIRGYDTAGLILSIVSEEIMTRNKFIKFLSGVDNYRGIGTTISFNDKRVNTGLPLLQFHGIDIIKIK